MEKPNPGSLRVQIRPSCPKVFPAGGDLGGYRQGWRPDLKQRPPVSPEQRAFSVPSNQSKELVTLPDAAGAGWGRGPGCLGGTGPQARSLEAHSPVGKPDH